MKEEKLKEAFLRIKEDMLSLGKEISEIRKEFLETNHLMKQINEEIIQWKLQKIAETPLKQTSTHPEKTSTHPATSTHTSTHPKEIEGLKTPNLDISIGNEGVSTDKQTDRQTVRHIQNTSNMPILATTEQEDSTQEQEDVVPNIEEQNAEQTQEKFTDPPTDQIETLQEKPIKQHISEASEILDSLDNIKKEIRKKFKRITRQEMLVFSTIYQLEEQDPEIDYKKLAMRLGLSQSSIRDYVQRIIAKGIPVDKEKLNNKKIFLHISPDLKKIATLQTIIKLREI